MEIVDFDVVCFVVLVGEFVEVGVGSVYEFDVLGSGEEFWFGVVGVGK